MALLHPTEKEIAGKKFILSKFPAIAGREIAAKYAAAGFPKIDDYAANEETMVKLMSYVAVPMGDKKPPLQLTTRALIDNHVDNWQMLVKIEQEMMELNSGFLEDGRA